MLPSISWPHPALDPSTHLIPSIRTYLPSLISHFTSHPWSQLSSWKSYYQQSDSFHVAITFCSFVSFYVWLMERITGNASQVDGLWTFLPVIYSLHFTFHDYLSSSSSLFQTVTVWNKVQPRLALMSALSILWSIRLTYNAIRRGMFKPGEEDYRWPILRKKIPSWFAWQLFSLFFIAIAQNILLAITALPQYLLLTTTFSKRSKAHVVPKPIDSLTWDDYVLAAVFVFNLSLQYLADHQQWTYQNYKRGLDPNEKPLASVDPVTRLPTQPQQVTPYSKPEDAKRGFVTRGLWSWSRHPNFACEQSTWWILFAFVPLTLSPSSSQDQWYKYLFNFATLSPLAMNALFLASTS
ncbi:DUF1295-domain-containing protein [Violaceomyces palustris]|uniref:DUF1295-domain-containing protein n=1 Tax=Violaceomyces palustris TaxID=1673888 RepID=A0ACD0NNY4_9BASI|nr:DUF1295-domain-containing protein [Violaceomyces palustris]